MIGIFLEVSNSPFRGDIWVDVIKFPYMTNSSFISHKAFSLGLVLVVLNARDTFPLTLQTLISLLFPLVNKSLGRLPTSTSVLINKGSW